MTLLWNAQIILHDRVITPGWIALDNAVITAYGELPVPPEHVSASMIDLQGAYVMPGIIDIHCDIIEKMVQPRPGVMLDTGLALHVTDRLLLSSGVTCEFHSLSLDDAEFGVRNDEFVRDFIMRINESQSTLIRHLVHARVEISSTRGTDTLAKIIAEPVVKLVSIMDHSPGQGQYVSDESFRFYVAKTTGRNDSEIDEIIAHKKFQRQFIPDRINTVVDLCHQYHIPIATHDDDTVAKIAEWNRLNIRISEFPTTMIAAHAAHQSGMLVGMGAPNVLRGKSSGGNLSARNALIDGVVDWLCADYYPSALLPAAFLISQLGIYTLPEAIALITANPAKAVGMQDTLGQIAVGMHADLCIVRVIDDVPVVEMVYVDGGCVYTARKA
ncbi:MAG: alpha-D-ribose 1-methylphosphonate 5-triphosphate diphosphatase [Roseiflexaceae bacterium]|jgi:alpha-D-ribose 1-methylphosphonate 5-triphosphate diphosphatase|nr:alpha-D-ribose 1-methylphosphonate 5-triphosphate diphosphatase [Chloroflexaceae bacterium]